MRIAIIGPGRLGRSLHVLLQRAGHHVALVGRGDARPAEGIRLVTVPDPEIATVARTLPPGGPVLHCAGALDHEVLRPHEVVGSLHPLMTFPGPEVQLPDLTGVPAAVAGDPEALAIATALTRDLGLVALEVPGDRRLYHASAVIAGNLALVLVAAAAQALEAAGVGPRAAREALVPLALRSVGNAREPLRKVLTGPVARGDREALRAHRDALAEHGLHHLLAAYDHLVTIAEVEVSHRDAEENHTG